MLSGDLEAVEQSARSIIDRYGLFNPDEAKMRPVPHPTTLVIDKQGVVRWKVVEIDYRVRPTNEDILAALTALD